MYPGNIQGALNTCQASNAPVTKIIAAGLRRAGGSEHDVQVGMDEEALRELPKLEKRTGYLAMLGNLATLAGLLGTITGLIKSFAGVAGVDPSMKATMLSKGISEAMNCTAFGLVTGIMGLAAYAVAERHDPARAGRHQPGHGGDAEPGRCRPRGWPGAAAAAVPKPGNEVPSHECFSRHRQQGRKEIRSMPTSTWFRTSTF